MSIDLYVERVRPVALRPLLPKVRMVLADMLSVPDVPELRIQVLEDGCRLDADHDELRDEMSPLFLISLSGEPETVALYAPGKQISISMATRRTSLEFALGAAIAIALARELGGFIEDGWHFFGEEARVYVEDFLKRLRVSGPEKSYREAAERFSLNLGKASHWP